MLKPHPVGLQQRGSVGKESGAKMACLQPRSEKNLLHYKAQNATKETLNY